MAKNSGGMSVGKLVSIIRMISSLKRGEYVRNVLILNTPSALSSSSGNCCMVARAVSQMCEVVARRSPFKLIG